MTDSALGIDSTTAAPAGAQPAFSRRMRTLMLLHVAAIVAFVLAFEFLPLQDYPQWIYHGVLLKGIVVDGFDVNGAYTLYHYIPPNTAAPLLIGIFDLVLAPEAAGKLFLIIAMLVMYAGIIRFMRITVRGHDATLAWLALFLVFSGNFWIGNLSFCFGLAAAFYGAYLLIDREWRFSLPKLLLLVTACYLCHFFSWFFLVLSAGGLALLQRDRRTIGRIAIAAIPSIALFVHYLLVKDAAEMIPNPTGTLMQHMVWKMQMLAGAIVPFHRFKGLDPRPVWATSADALFFALFGALAVMAAYHALRARRLQFNLIVALPLPIIMLALPYNTAGIVNPAQRMMLYFAVNVIAYGLVAFPRIVRSVGVLGAFFACAALTYGVSRTEQFDTIVHTTHPPTAGPYIGGGDDGAIDAYLHLEFYDIIRHPRPVPLFLVGPIRYRDSAEIGNRR